MKINKEECDMLEKVLGRVKRRIESGDYPLNVEESRKKDLQKISDFLRKLQLNK